MHELNVTLFLYEGMRDAFQHVESCLLKYQPPISTVFGPLGIYSEV